MPFVVHDLYNLVSNVSKHFVKSDVLRNVGSIVKIQKLDVDDKEIYSSC